MDERVLLDVIPDAVLVIERDRVTWSNAAAAALLGNSPTGRSVEDVLGPGQLARLELVETQRAAGWPLPAGVRLDFARTDGVSVTAEVMTAVLPDGAYVLCARDITQATRAEALMGKLALLSSDSPLLDGPDALLDASEPVFLALGWTASFTEVFRDNSITRRILSAEGSAIGDYGRSVIGRRLPMDRTPLIAEVVRTKHAVFLDNVPALLIEGRAAALSDSMLKARVARSAWCPVLRDDVVSHVLGVTGPDLTEHDFVAIRLFAAELGASLHLGELRRELVRRERLAALGEMAAVLAHEVRNPLGAIFAAVATLRRRSATTDGEIERTRLLDILVEEGGRLQRVATDLLTFAHPTPANLEAVELAPLVENALDLARHDPSHAERTPKVTLDIAPDIGTVWVDPDLVTRALVNLLINAFQHVPVEGEVSVAATAANGKTVVRVHNEGTPLAPELLEKVFEPFYTTRPSGTGLGLAIVRRIAADLGGDIGVESKDDGVAFVLRLRRA
jgi:signal transduction histidine kinase